MRNEVCLYYVVAVVTSSKDHDHEVTFSQTEGGYPTREAAVENARRRAGNCPGKEFYVLSPTLMYSAKVMPVTETKLTTKGKK